LNQRFAYQPSWVAFCIFWGSIITGVSLAIIIQEEMLTLSWPAILLLIVTLVSAIIQKRRYRLELTATELIFHRFFPSNDLHIKWSDIANFEISGHQIFFDTTQYGRFAIVSFRKIAAISTALTAQKVKQVEEEAHV